MCMLPTHLGCEADALEGVLEVPSRRAPLSPAPGSALPPFVPNTTGGIPQFLGVRFDKSTRAQGWWFVGIIKFERKKESCLRSILLVTTHWYARDPGNSVDIYSCLKRRSEELVVSEYFMCVLACVFDRVLLDSGTPG